MELRENPQGPRLRLAPPTAPALCGLAALLWLMWGCAGGAHALPQADGIHAGMSTATAGSTAGSTDEMTAGTALNGVLSGGANQAIRLDSGPVFDPPQNEAQNLASPLATGTGGERAGSLAPQTAGADPAVQQLAAGAGRLLDGQVSFGAVQTALMLGVLSLVPAILLMTTSYVRIVVVLGLLRQAFGTQQLPPTQVLAALSVFVTILVMAPVWQEIRREAIDPCLQASQGTTTAADWEQILQRGVAPLKRFMVAQIVATGNLDAIRVFHRHAWRTGNGLTGSGSLVSSEPLGASEPGVAASGEPVITAANAGDVPMNVILPAFLVSELKVAFLLGFQIFLPFLVLDLVVSTLGVSMGMVMLPPSMISLPLKLILFVMADGWNLVLGMLLQSFHALPSG